VPAAAVQRPVLLAHTHAHMHRHPRTQTHPRVQGTGAAAVGAGAAAAPPVYANAAAPAGAVVPVVAHKAEAATDTEASAGAGRERQRKRPVVGAQQARAGDDRELGLRGRGGDCAVDAGACGAGEAPRGPQRPESGGRATGGGLRPTASTGHMADAGEPDSGE
jgi:hypothetical protein